MAKKVVVAVTKKAGGAKIISCNCISNYQDQKYGNNKRVHNNTQKGSRCTICNNEKTVS